MAEPWPAAFQTDAPAVARAEIRVLGTLRARRADGSLVDPRLWRTGKTADLVRLLAVRSREAVPVDTLLDALWPDVDERRGRASLRTAAAQIRRVLGQDSLERRLGGLALSDVWVDAVAFAALAREARRLAATGARARLVSVTREAEALYLGEFRAHNDSAEWAMTERETLASIYRILLMDAADAAVELGWMRDAVDFATRALAVDPCSERASRALMQGYAGVGETSRALREYERCRVALAEELGADPSPETRAIHLQLLADPAVPTDTPFVGRDAVAQQLRSVLEKSLRDRRPTLVMVVGRPGSGKSRLVREALHDLPARVIAPVVTVGDQPLDVVAQVSRALGSAPSSGTDGLARCIAGSEPVVLVLAGAETVSAASLSHLDTVMSGTRGGVSVVVESPAGGPERTLADLSGTDLRHREHRFFQLQLQPMRAPEVAQLARVLLASDIPAELLGVLIEVSEGLPGRVIDTVRNWMRSGRLAATAQGLVLLPDGGQQQLEHSGHQMLAPLLDQLGEGEILTLQMMAVLDRPATPAMVSPLLTDAGGPASLDPVNRAFDVLVDLSVLTAEPSGYAFRDPLLADAVRSWLRPSVRQQLHRRIAERAELPAEPRIDHWLKAGEPVVARDAAMRTAAEAIAGGRYEDARGQLLQASSLGVTVDVPPRDRVALFERLGDVCARLRLADEARAAYEVAVSVSRAQGLPDLARVTAKADQAGGPEGSQDPSPATAAAPPEPGALDVQPDPTGCMMIGPEFEGDLREKLEEADLHNDPRPKALARLLLASALLSRRDFQGSRACTQEALEPAVGPELRARAVVVYWLPDVLLGKAAAAEGPLQHARDLLSGSDDAALARCLAALAVSTAHDLGRPDADQLLRAAIADEALMADPCWSWIPIRVAAERRAVDLAQLAEQRSLLGPSAPTTRLARDLARATLRVAQNQVSEAVDLLRSVITAGTATGSTLLQPEAIARLIALEAETDLDGAKEHFELLDWAAGGDHRFPRENCLRMLARAAVRAATGQMDAAALAAANAADVAEEGALPFLSAQAHHARAGYLAAAGRWSESRLAQAAATRCHRAAGVPDLRSLEWRGAMELGTAEPRPDPERNVTTT